MAGRDRRGGGRHPGAARRGAADPLAGIVTKEGSKLLAAGQIATVLGACRAIPAPLRTPEIEQLEGEAQQIQGDWSEAMTCFQRAAAGRETLPAHLAWRIGLIHYLRGEPEAALAVYERGVDDPGADPWRWRCSSPGCRPRTGFAGTSSHAGSSRPKRSRRPAPAVIIGAGSGTHGDGDAGGARWRPACNDAHYLLALRAAEEASDVLQVVRIRTNRGSHFMEEGSYAEALQELDVAVRLAELTSFASFLALSLSNRGETKLRMGRIEEALADLEASGCATGRSTRTWCRTRCN